MAYIMVAWWDHKPMSQYVYPLSTSEWVVVEETGVKIGHNVRTTNKWVGFNPNNILNNTGL